MQSKIGIKRAVTLCLVLCLTLTSCAALAMGTMTYYVACSNGGNLNLRESASKNSQSLVKIPYGAKLEIAGLSDDKAWGYTSYQGKTGWVMMSFLSTEAPDMANSKAEKALSNVETMNSEFAAMTKNPLTQTYQVIIRTNKTTTLYHMRWAPYLSAYAVRSDVKNGEVFTVTAEGKSWYQVQDNQSSRVGYIVKSICQPWVSTAN